MGFVFLDNFVGNDKQLYSAKIKAQIYPDNFRVRNFLKDCGFVYETTLKNETLRGGKFQDIEIYALYRNYYYKDSR